MLKKILLLLFSIIISLQVAGISLAHAEESGDMNAEVTAETNIQTSDLEVNNTGMLPTSPWYFLKEWTRSVKRLFTLDPVKKAELELNIANEKAAETLRVEEKNPNKPKDIQRAINNYKASQEKLKAKIESLKENSENPNISKLVERVDTFLTKHEMLFHNIQDRAKEKKIKVKVEDVRDSLKKTDLEALAKDEKAKERAKEMIDKAEKVLGVLSQKMIALKSSIETNVSSANKIKSLETLLENAKKHLAKAKEAFEAQKFGAAYGLAQSVKVEVETALLRINAQINVDKNTKEKRCLPRPACLDATPRCMIAEPAGGWCPK